MAKVKGKVYVWIGDDGDNQSVSIERKVYTRDEVIPGDKVAPDVLASWIERGLVSEDGQRLVSVESPELEAEVKALKKENANIREALDKARSGNKANVVKAAKDETAKAVKRAEIAEADIEEKAALIEKHASRITELEAEVKTLTEPKSDAGGDGGGAGPGGSSE